MRKELIPQLVRKAGRRIRRELKHLSTEAENLVLGKTNSSLLRALQVSDSSTIEPSQLELGCAKSSVADPGWLCLERLGQQEKP